MNELGKILIAGTGPAALQSAVLLGKLPGTLGLAGRESQRALTFFDALEAQGNMLHATVQNERHRSLAGQVRIDQCFRGYQRVAGKWNTLLLAVTADAYLEVLGQLAATVLCGLDRIVLLSPTLGSARLVEQYAKPCGAKPEVISFSSYLGDTRWAQQVSGTCVLTAGVKTRIYAGSTAGSSPALAQLCQLHESVGTAVQVLEHPVDAEARNMSLYVHPALFMNEFTLQAVFGSTQPPKYVYKLYPEGPITPTLIHTLVQTWHEISKIIGALGGRKINLLEFMLHDGYPVHRQSIDSASVSEFEQLPAIHQEYLIYVRYASLLIDPFSQPDPAGRYFDFSAVPIKPIFRNDDGDWEVPRMPKEDYYRTKIIQGLAQQLKISCPTLDTLLTNYQHALARSGQLLAGQPCSKDFEAQDFAGDLEILGDGLRSAA